MNFFKRCIRKILYREDATSDDLLNYLRAKGATIGKGVRVYAPNKTLIDKTTPFLLTIGDYVRIAEGVKILTHDYSWSVMKRYSSDECEEGRVLGSQGPVVIGNNVFIGMNAVISCGVTVGDNVIIGAGSIVTKDCESNSVYAGNPAKKIMSIDDFYIKRRSSQAEEARRIVLTYKGKFGKIPPEDILSEYFMLFASKETALRNSCFTGQMNTSDNFNASLEILDSQVPVFGSYSDFLDFCFSERGDVDDE